MVALEVLRTGGAAVTTTVSAASPTVNTGLNPRTPRALTTRLSCLRVRNPLAWTLREYVPGGRGAMVYRPEDEEVRWVELPVAMLVAATVALGMAAPVLSVTVPVI